MEPYHEELSSKAWSMWEHHSLRNIFFFESLSSYWTFPFVSTRFLLNEPDSVYKFIIDIHTMQSLHVGESKKQQKRGGIILNFTKGETFFISYNNQVLLRVILQLGLPSCTLQKRLSSFLQFGQEENIPRHLFEKWSYWFVLKTVKLFQILTRRVKENNEHFYNG